MGNFLGIPILTIAAILQATFFSQFRVLGGQPNLVLLFVISWAINSGLRDGIIWAFIGGIVLDLFSMTPTGTSVMGMLIMVFGISSISHQIYNIGFAVLAGLILFGTLLQESIGMIILAIIGHPVNWVIGFTYIIPPTIFLNLMLIWPIYWFVRRLQKRLGIGLSL